MYANSLTSPFVFDDVGAIATNPDVTAWSRLVHLFSPHVVTPLSGRPLAALSLVLNYQFGGFDVVSWHIANIALHAGCAALLLAAARRTLALPSMPEWMRSSAPGIAFAIALTWVVHPLNTEVVDYVIQRTESLMALFYLAAVYANVRGAGSRPQLWKGAAVACCALGMMCKEAMVTAPAMLLLYDWTFLSDSFRAWAARWRYHVALCSTWIVLAACVAIGGRGHDAAAPEHSAWIYVLNQPRMIVRYLRLSFWPHSSLVALYGLPHATTLGNEWPYIALMAVLAAGTLVALIRVPRIGFLGAWFFITLAPTSTVVQVTYEVGAERRMYLPLIAVVSLVAVGIAFLLRRVGDLAPESRRAPRRPALAAAAILAIVVALLAAQTIHRNTEYRSGLTLAQTVVARWPSGAGSYQLGSELMAAGRRDEAIERFRDAVPEYPRARFYLGQVLFDAGRQQEAVAQLETFNEEHPDFAEVVRSHLLIGAARLSARRWADAAAEAQRALAMTPGNADAEFLLADALSGADRFGEAVPHYRAYLAAKPRDVMALTNLGVALAQADRTPEAVPVFRAAAEVEPQNAAVRLNLARALFESNDVTGASREAEEAVKLKPWDPAARDLFGRLLALQDHLAEAATQFRQAVALDPTDEEARRGLAALDALTKRR